ncbi:MAG: CRTAC1 family protein [Candidatus Latescibacteria bacterium]|nr:CRTAC1 family protein [Candidatus Latescibacterota bacterium]
MWNHRFDPDSASAAVLVRLLLLCPLPACTPAPPPRPPVQFTEVTRQAGIDFVHYNGAQGDYYYVETFGSGAAFFDCDQDGWQDLFLANGCFLSGQRPDRPPTSHLYRNQRDGTFADVTATTGIGHQGYAMGCAAADYDEDGDQDLYLSCFGPNALYRNDRGHFAEVGRQLGVDDPRWGVSSGFLDYDLDGDLDLFAVNYVDFTLDHNPICRQGKVRSYCEPTVYEPTGSVLYRNEGRGQRFSEVSQEAGITLKGRGLGLAFFDYDLDGDTDIYVTNDGMMNFLYENRGGCFVENGLQAGARFNRDGQAMAGMGVDLGDLDNDGNQDLMVANFSRETNTLFHNLGQGRFEDLTARAGLAEPSYLQLGFGLCFLDYDGDMDLDLFVANGHVSDRIAELDSSLSYAQTNQLLRNEGALRFAEVSAISGPSFAVKNVGRAAVMADYDNDGDEDLLVTTEAGPPRLLRNDGGNRQHWLSVELRGKAPRDALGARVTVEAGGVRQVRERQSGRSYLASHDPRLHFGLGENSRARVEVRWPDGQVQEVGEVAADQFLKLEEP